MSTVIAVHELTHNPTILWDKLKNKQKQKKLDISKYTKHLKKQKADSVRFVLISDTHNRTDELNLPEGDVLLHAGDFTNIGRPSEVDQFNDFLGREKHKFKHVIVICGNHELSFDPDGCDAGFIRLDEETRKIDHRHLKEKLTNCTYIEDASINVMGFNIYGSPWQPEFHKWAYNLPRGQPCLDKWNLIPDDTDILITHGPPLGYGDLCSSRLRAGCTELLSTIQQRVKPMMHVFGHIHEGYGLWADDVTTYVNASTCTLRYKATNPPIVIDLIPPQY